MAGERGAAEFEMSLESTQARRPRLGKEGELECAGKRLFTEGGAPAPRGPGPTPSVLLYPFREGCRLHRSSLRPLAVRKARFSRNALFSTLPRLRFSLAGAHEGSQARKPVLRRNALPSAPRCTQGIAQSQKDADSAKTRRVCSEERAEDG